MTKLEQIYLDILTEQSSPTTFTSEELLYDAAKECFFSTGEFMVYDIEDINSFCDDANKPLFSKLVKNLKFNDDYAIIIAYFLKYDDIEYVFSKNRYMKPHHHYGFSLDKVKSEFKSFFSDQRNTAGNFNSIDVCPELGCIIGLNGAKIKTNCDFEKELDHELNHYFEGMNVHYGNADMLEKIELNDVIVDELFKFYGVSFNKKTFINDLKRHLFSQEEFRSMSANVFHEILRYNETHFKQLEVDEVINDITSRNWRRYEDRRLQEILMFCWVCSQLSSSRWSILLDGMEEACRIKKNIFQKFYIAGKGWFRSIVMKFGERS